MSVSIFLSLLGSILLLGVLGNFFFRRTRVPNSVTLILVGILLGPITGVVNGADFQNAAPFFGTVALILILFEGGLEIDLFEALGQAKAALILGLSHFILSVAGVFTVAVFAFNLSPSIAIFYGFVLGGTSPAVILPVLQNLKLESRGHALFSLETVVTEVLTVVTTVLAIDFTVSEQTPSLIGATAFVLHSFGTASGIAIIAAWGWSWVIPFVEKSGMSHLVTLAFLFLLYAFSASIHAEPAVTILLFGLLLENGHHVSEWLQQFLPKHLHRWIDIPVKNDQRLFSTLFFEMSFLVRTFFFVIMGLLFNFSSYTSIMYLAGFFLIVVFYASRSLSLKLLTKLKLGVSNIEMKLGRATIPRGLATAVVALMVQQAQIPGTENLLPLAFLAILGSNLLTVLLLRNTSSQVKIEI